MIRGLFSIAIAAMISVSCAGARADDAAAACRLAAMGTGKVSTVVDGASFMLADGREVRLAGIEAPLPRSGPTDARDATARVAKTALESLVAGATVSLQRLGTDTDRYGRIVAYAVVNRDGIEIAVQPAMLAQGHARVSARTGDRDCAKMLMAAERLARKAKLGLWADPYYQVHQAANPAGVLADEGRFAVVEGQVVSVRSSGGTIYVNFGRVWSRDFTVTIATRKERIFTAAGLAPKDLEGRTIRVRGWVEKRGGPQIEASAPEQIEIADVH